MKRAFRELPSPPALFALALLFGATSQGCGRAAPQQTNQIPAASLQQAQLYAQQGVLTCKDAYNCQQSVALLTAAEPATVSLCTTFLIAPDLMATNNHCIPKDLRTPGADCSGRIWVRFASSVDGTPGEQAECKSIVRATEKNELNTTDYAFIKLDHRLRRAPFKFSHGGLSDGAQYLVHKVNPISKTAALGSLEQVYCKTPQRTLITPEFDNDLAPLATVADCEIVHGNSGSPVLDEKGKIRGIIQATETADKLKANLAKKDIQLLDGDLAPLGVATSFACIRAPSEPESLELPSGCSAPVSPQTPSDYRKISEKAARKLIAQWNDSATPSTLHVDWNDGAPIAQSDNFTVAPHCFKPALDWLGSSQTQALDVELPVWSARMGVNRYLQTDYRYSLTSQALHARLSFNPAQLRAQGRSPVTLTSDGVSPALFDGAIPICR